MNFATLFKAFDTVVVLREAVRRLKGDAPPAAGALSSTAPGPLLPGQLEARLSNVVVAALKEAFDRDHARLELEREQLAEQRRRAEEALRAELRRQAVDREVGRLRMLAGTALVGWIASVALFVARLDVASPVARGITAAGWLVLLAALWAAFSAQGKVDGSVRLKPDTTNTLKPDTAGAGSGPTTDWGGETGARGMVALWLLVAGLGLSAASLLF